MHSSSHKRHRSALWGLNGVAKNTPLAWTRTPPARVHRTSSDGGAKILGPPAAYLNTLHELPSTSDNFRPASSARLGPAALKIYWLGRYKNGGPRWPRMLDSSPQLPKHDEAWLEVRPRLDPSRPARSSVQYRSCLGARLATLKITFTLRTT